MSTENPSGFDFVFDPSLDPMGDPFDQGDDASDIFLPNTEGRTEFLPPDPDRVPVIDHAVKQDSAEYAARPADERTRELLAQMRPHRAVLLNILDAARTPLSTAQIEQDVADLRTRKFSIYTTSNLCTMLETAGALARVTAGGEPYASVDPKPETVVVDGEEFYRPATPPAVCWLATEAGLAAFSEDDEADRLERMLERESDLLPVYKRVLAMAADGGGALMPQLSAAVDGNPLIAEPRRFFVQHFVEALERCSAIVWKDGAWRATELGLRTLEGRLADVADDYEPEQGGASGSIATETDGIRW